MATRLNYVLPIARQLLLSTGRRLRPSREGLRPGGLAASIAAPSSGRPFIIVTGAGRSGTSAVARVLHESGIRMGRGLEARSDANPDGFYEDLDVWLLDERILTELGKPNMWRPERWPWRSTVLAVARSYHEEMKGLIANAEDGWKDPRFAITLEAWLPLFPAQPKLVICLRSPHAYADSVTRLFGLVDRRAAERQWARHYRRLLDVIRDYGLTATCVEYDALVDRPEETTAALAEFVGHPLNPAYVNPPLRRFERPVPEKYERLYQEVRALAKTNRVAGRAVIDGTSAATDASTSPEPSPSDEDRARKPLSDEQIGEIDAYLELVNDIDSRMSASKAAWTQQVGLPRPKLTHSKQAGPALSQTIELTRAASAAYASMLEGVQDRLRALHPPRGFERYHEMTLYAADLERMQAEMMLAAAQGETPDRRMLRTAVRAWRRFGQRSAVEKAEARRRRAYDLALEASGYLAVRGAATEQPVG